MAKKKNKKRSRVKKDKWNIQIRKPKTAKVPKGLPPEAAEMMKENPDLFNEMVNKMKVFAKDFEQRNGRLPSEEEMVEMFTEFADDSDDIELDEAAEGDDTSADASEEEENKETVD